MKKTHVLSWSLCSVLAFACAQTSGGEDPVVGDGDGDSTMLPSGGTTTAGTGGTAVVIGSGGTSTGGGLVGDGDGDAMPSGGAATDDCMDGETAPCAEHAADFPVGIALCTMGAWDINSCAACVADQMYSCGEVYPTLPAGTVTCNSTGTGWVADPATVCEACTLDETISCDDASNPGPDRFGMATCTETGFDWSTCELCEEGGTLNCADVPDNNLVFGTATCNEDRDGWDVSSCQLCEPDVGTTDCIALDGGMVTFTSGTATCNSMGDGFDDSTCGYCGDGVANGPEDCDDGDLPVTTCVGEGLPEGDSMGANLSCDLATCTFDTSVCSACLAGVAEGDCLEGNPVSCSDSADCTGKQCGVGSDCDFNCSYQDDCTNLSCNGATCDIACTQEADCQYTCHAGSTCTQTTAYNSFIDASCEADATCAIVCPGLGACAVDCEAGSNCSVNAVEYEGSPTGQAVCSSGICEYDIQSQETVTMGIHCQAGATCNINVDKYQTRVDNIVCDAGSVCNITCGTQQNSCNCTGDGCP